MATAMDFALEQVKGNLAEFTYQFKKAYSGGGMYRPTENVSWTTGFWARQVWLAHEQAKRTGDEAGAGALKAAGKIQIRNFLERIKKEIEVDHHDMGLLYSPSCVAGLKLMGSEKGKEAAVRAAGQFISRFHPIREFIQAWGPTDQPENYRFIVNCLLNLPLLYWASKEAGDKKYREIAGEHLRTATVNVIRKNYSIWHVFFTNMETEAPDHEATRQGYRGDSAWARDQAWGVCGMALAYRCAGRKEYVEDFRHMTGYFLEHLPGDLVPYWDLEFDDGSGEPRDSSPVSIAACGMLEVVKYLRRDDAAYYTGIAKKLMKPVVDSYAVKDQTESNGLVLHSAYSKESPCSTCTPERVGECNIWGDYFYMGALIRLAGDWNLY